MRSGGISKDTWVVGDGAPDLFYENLKKQQTVVIRPARPPSGVPSRVADHLFWFGRYVERLEASTRVLRAVMQRLAGERSLVQGHEVDGCVSLMVYLGLVPAGTANALDHLPALLTDQRRPGSIPDLLGRLRYNAAAARDRLSDDMWRLVNRLERDARLPAGAFLLSSAQGVLDNLILDLAAIAGMQQENMTRGHGWRFLELGRRIERACGVLELTGAATECCEQNDSLLTPLLEICDSTMTYRRLHFARPSLAPTLDLLLLNDINPRSVIHQLQIMGRLSAQLPQVPGTSKIPTPREQTDSLLSDLSAVHLDSLARDAAGMARVIPEVCGRLVKELEKLSDIITEHFFSHASRSSE